MTRDPPAPLDWTPEGAPRSRAFDDIYFQPGEGLAETRAVFLEGCGLPDAWLGRDRFVVGELGFGTGLNILALLDLWRRCRVGHQRLHIFSVEAFPLTAQDAERALAAWPELADLVAPLLAAWPRRARGFHRLDFPDLGATLDLAVGDAADALVAWPGRADAWFLDGFSPAKNPQMWSPQVLDLVAARSAPGARLATFTVAGAVRRGLEAAGFCVARMPGHGRKRQRLEARLGGDAVIAARPRRVVIVGAGIAGASLARAAAAEGLEALVIAGDEGASANPGAIVSPALDAGERAGGRLHAQALARAHDLYSAIPGAVLGRGVVQMERQPRDPRRFDTIAASGLFEPGAVVRLDPEAVAERLGEAPAAGGLWLRDALSVDPGRITGAWLAGANRLTGRVTRIERRGDGWRLLGEDGRLLAEADIVCLAPGAGLPALSGLTATVLRGQASWAAGVEPGQAAGWGGYCTPTADGVLFGATHDRGDEGVDVRPQDDARNLAALSTGRPRLAAGLTGRPLGARAALRSTSRDRMPAAGALGDGLYVLGALGGRGFTTAPLLAEHVVSLICGAPSPLPEDLSRIVEPARLRPSVDEKQGDDQRDGDAQPDQRPG